MPRGKLSERTKKQIDTLPEKAQRTFRKAHESALKQYKSPGKRRRKSDTAEAVAQKVAWSAVKKKYRKSGDKWVSKSSNNRRSKKTKSKKEE
jgi:cation transport regulator